jgi:hypothetical protein
MIMAIVNNVPSPPDMETSKYDPRLAPKKPKPKPKPKPKTADMGVMDMMSEEVVTAKSGGMMYSKGGSASSRADGCAKRGKTKGTMVKM